MDVRSDIFPDTPDGFHPRDVSVRLARPDERIRWDRLMNQHHYLGFKRFPGRGLPYVFEWRGQWVGLAGWQSGAFKCRHRDQWIGWKRELQFTRMHLIANNTAIPDIFFLLFIIMKLFLFFKYLFRAIFSPKICLPSGKTISSGKNDAEFVPQTSIDAGNA